MHCMHYLQTTDSWVALHAERALFKLPAIFSALFLHKINSTPQPLCGDSSHWRTFWFCRLWRLWAMCLIPYLCRSFWESCKGGQCDRSFPGLTHTGTQKEHSSVLGSACYAYLNRWRAISGCHAVAFHIILSPTPCRSGSLSFLPTLNFLSFCLSPSPLQLSYAFLHHLPLSVSDSTCISSLLTGWFIGSGLPGLNSSLHYGNLVMLNASSDAG